ncbi:uncharacterized protein [Panulirus ornatus]
MEGAAGFVACQSNDQDDCFKDRSSALCHKVEGAESEEMSADRCCRSCNTPLLFKDSNVGAYWRRKEADEVLNKLITEIRGKSVDDCVKLKNEPVEQMDDLDSQLSCHADSSFHKTMRTSYLDNCDTRAPSVERNENMCRNELDSLSSRGELPCHEQETHSVLHTGIVKEEKNEYLSTELDTSQDLETPWIPRYQQFYHFVKEEVDIKMDIYDECLEEQVNDQMIDNDTGREFNIPELVSNKKDGGTKIKTEPNSDLDTIQNDFMECQQVDFKNLTASCTDGTSSHYCEYDTSNAEASSVVSMESLSVPALSRLSEKTNTFLPESHTEKTCDEQITEKDEHCTCKGLLKQKENLDYEESLVEQRDCIRTQISNLSYRFSDVVRRTKLLEENVMLKPQIEEKICNIRNRITKLNEILCFEGNLNSGAHCLKWKTLKRPGEPKFGLLYPFKKPALEASFCEPNETEDHTQMYESAMSINSNVKEECKGKVLSSLENCSLDCQHKRKTNDDDSINDQGCMNLNENKISQRKESKKSRKGHVNTRSGSTEDGESLRNDAHMNWCKLCNVFAQSVIDYVHHLGSSEHSQRKKINDDSWLRMLPQTEKRQSLQEESRESYGVEFLDSATVFFCNLCKVLIWDKEEVMLHPRSPLHVQNFKDFVSGNDLSASGFHQRKMSAFLKHCEGREADNNGRQTESNEKSESCQVSASHTFTDVVKSPCQENYCIPEIEIPHTTKINPTLCWSQNSKSSTVVTSTNLSENNTVDIPVTLTDGNECNGTYESIKEMPFFPANKTDSSSGSTTKSTPIIASKLRSSEGEFNKNSLFLRKPRTFKTTENITDTLMNKDDRFTQPRVAISDLEDSIEAAKTVEGETSQNEKISALTHQEEGTSITTDSIRVDRRGRNCIAPNDSLSISKSSKRKLKSKARAKDKLKSLKTAYNKIGFPVTLEKSENEPATSPEIIKPPGIALSAVNFKDEIKRHSISDDTDTQSGTASKSSGIREESSEITPLQPNDIQVEQTKNATESSGLSPRNVNRVKSRDNLSKLPKHSACVIDVAKEKLIDKDKHASVKITMISNDSAISDSEDLIEAAKTVEGETSQNEKISALTRQEEGTSITTDSIIVNRRGRNCIAPNDSLSISKRKLKSKTRAKDKLKSLKTAYNKIGSPVTLEKSENEPATSPEIIKPLGSALSADNFKDEIKRHSISDDTDTQSGTASKSSGIREKSSEITPLQPNDIQVEQTKNATESSGLSLRNVNRVKSRDNLSKLPKHSACVIDVAKEKLTDKDKHASVKMTMISNDAERKPKNSVKFENLLNYDEFQNFNNKVKNEVCSVGKKKRVKTNTIKRKNISLPKRKPEILKNVKSKLSYSVSCDLSSNLGKTPSSSVETKNLVEPNTASNSKCEATNSLSIGTKALIKSDETSAAKALKVNSAMDIHDAIGDSSMAPQTTTSFVNAEMISQFIKCQREKSVYFSDDALTLKRAIGAPLGICKLDNTLAMTSQNQSSAVDDTKKLSKTDTAPDILTANEIKGCHLGAVNTLSTDAGDESTSLSCNESKTVLNHNVSSAETINTHGSATKINSRESISQPATPTILAAKSDSSISESMTSSSSAKSKISLNDYWERKGTCTRKIKENTSTATSSAQNSSDHSFVKADRISEQHTEHDWICIRSGGESSQVVLPDANLMASRPDSEQVSQHTVNLLADLDSRKTHIAFASEASKAKVGQAFTRDLKNHTEKSNKQGTSISKPQPKVKINNFLKTVPRSIRIKSRKKAWKSSNVLLIGDKRLESIAYKPSLRSAKKIICIPHLQLPEALAIIKKELKAVNFDAVFLMVGHADITVQIQDEKCKACGCSTPFGYLKVKPENFQPFLDMVSQVNSILKSLFPKLYILWGSLYPINMHDYLSKATAHQNFSNTHKCGSDIGHYISTNNLALKSVNHVYEEFNETFTKFLEKYEMPHVDFCKFSRNKKKLCSDFHSYLSDGIHLNDRKLTICLADNIRNAITLSLLWMQKNKMLVDEIKT